MNHVIWDELLNLGTYSFFFDLPRSFKLKLLKDTHKLGKLHLTVK